MKETTLLVPPTLPVSPPTFYMHLNRPSNTLRLLRSHLYRGFLNRMNIHKASSVCLNRSPRCPPTSNRIQVSWFAASTNPSVHLQSHSSHRTYKPLFLFSFHLNIAHSGRDTRVYVFGNFTRHNYSLDPPCANHTWFPGISLWSSIV